ncbi:MAG: protein-glutamine glutaminase family protein [Gemmatimonadota bacterium]
MPIENAVVDRIRGLEPPMEGSGAEMLRKNPEGVEVVFADGRRARVRARERPTLAAGWLEILDALRGLDAPAFVEFDPETRDVTRLLIPLVATITELVERGDQIDVDLEISQARHRIRRSNPDFGALLETLQTALARGTRLFVSETDDHEIIDVRPDPRGGGTPPGTRRAGERYAFEPERWIRELFEWVLLPVRCLFCWFRCVSPRRAQQLFDLAAVRTCDPLSVPVPCIPFLYPDDGCWGRAHEMCRLFIADGAHPRKIWIYGSLHVDTANNPSCYVNWGWHVAPIVCVRKFFFWCRNMVIDPALFDTPVSESTWKSVQGDPGAVLERAAASIFYRSIGAAYTETDPTYTKTNTVLATYRLQLQNRALAFGPPPYAGCP